MSRSDENILSGEKLKELMLGGVLPAEYINEANINTLLQHELEEMGGDENYDISTIDYCTELLKNYHDSEYEVRKQRTYNNLKKQINQYYKDQTRRKKKSLPLYGLKRTAFIAGTVVILLISAQLIGYAWGISLLNVVLEWGEEQLSIVIKNNTDITDAPPLENQYIEFYSLDEFTQNCPHVILPEYLSDGFEFLFADKTVDDTYNEYNIGFYNSSLQSQLIFLIKEFANSTAEKEYQLEIDNEYNEVYEYNGIPHYITSNYESYNVVWSYENFVYIMATPLPLDEIKLIINSFYGGNLQ